jgi:Cytochrome c
MRAPETTSVKRFATLTAAAAALVAVLAAAPARPATGTPGETAAPASKPDAEAVARGRYLVAITACNDCHTPLKMGPNGPEPDMARMLSGHPEGMTLPPPPAASGPWIWSGLGTNTAFAGPWGISYSANLTPDEATGLGIWTEDMFVKAMRTGKHFGQSRPILPPMPWPWIAQMTDDDLKAVYAYLRTVPPVVNHVPDPVPPAAASAPPSR